MSIININKKNNNNNNDNNNGPIYAAIIGGFFFAIPYILLNTSFLGSLVLGVLGFTAGSFIFSNNSNKKVIDKKDPLKQTVDAHKESINNSMKKIIQTAKGQNQLILSMIYRVESESLKENITAVNKIAGQIIDTVEKNPEKYDKAQSFFTYYLPSTLKILARYDDIEDSRLDTKETKEFMADAEAMIIKIRKSFKKQLSNLYAADLMDTDAEMKVFETMLNSEGISTSDDFSNLNNK